MVWPFGRKGSVEEVGRRIDELNATWAATWGAMSPTERRYMHNVPDAMQALLRALTSVQERPQTPGRLQIDELRVLGNKVRRMNRISVEKSRSLSDDLASRFCVQFRS